MNGRKALVMIVCTLAGMALVAWLGYTYRNETVAFLRALKHAL